MGNNPLCSVVMSVYNGSEFLSDAIESILQQTYKNFEFIIINDASTDNSLEIIKSYNDHRIVLIENKKNIFLAASLNKGIKASQGKYIIRMDADDISMPNRISKQVQYMENNPDIGICGTCSEIIGFNPGYSKYSAENHIIKYKLLYECHLLHPTIIIRSDIIEKHQLYYNESYRKNQDYELFVRAIDKTNYGNILDYLLKYRQTEHNIKREVHDQNQNVIEIQKKLFRKLGLEISEEEINLYKCINYQIYNDHPKIVSKSLNLINKLSLNNGKTLLFEKNQFDNHLAKLFENVCRNSTEPTSSILICYLKSRIRTNYIIKIKILVILLLKLVISIFKI
tara:strand:- start:11039 stop:12055 length:1017 start_codon:yes stop_codon:yes gene_type:complete